MVKFNFQLASAADFWSYANFKIFFLKSTNVVIIDEVTKYFYPGALVGAELEEILGVWIPKFGRSPRALVEILVDFSSKFIIENLV